MSYILGVVREEGAVLKSYVLVIVLCLCILPTGQHAYAGGDSHVIGWIAGTHRELPGYFSWHRDEMNSKGVEDVEFTGFKLVNIKDGKAYSIWPNLDGYFYRRLPSGPYTLTRRRNDRPDYREEKTIDLLRFEVRPETIVNLGTISIILDGEPQESLTAIGDNARGRYTYRYGYEREPGDEAFDHPLTWFTDKKPGIAAGLEGKVLRVEAKPSTEKDGSEVVLRLSPPPPFW